MFSQKSSEAHYNCDLRHGNLSFHGKIMLHAQYLDNFTNPDMFYFIFPLQFSIPKITEHGSLSFSNNIIIPANNNNKKGKIRNSHSSDLGFLEVPTPLVLIFPWPGFVPFHTHVVKMLGTLYCCLKSVLLAVEEWRTHLEKQPMPYKGRGRMNIYRACTMVQPLWKELCKYCII